MSKTETADETEASASIDDGKIIRLDEAQFREHLDRQITASVEERLNKLLDAEADALCGAKRYERSPERQDTRAGHYERKLHTKAGEVSVKVPKLRTLPFETQIIERYKRRESSVDEALMEMYLAGVSVRRVEDITEALWGVKVSPSTVSELNQKIYGQIEEWRNQPIRGGHACEDLDAARDKAAAVVTKLRSMKLPKAAEMVETGIEETLCYMAFPREHWRCLRTNNPLERLIREVRRRTRVVGAFPDGNSALMLVAARLRYMTGTKWGLRRYLDMTRLNADTTAQPLTEANAS